LQRKYFLLDLFFGPWYDLDMASLTAKQIGGHTYYCAPSDSSTSAAPPRSGSRRGKQAEIGAERPLN
jgi:hypothetical protein